MRNLHGGRGRRSGEAESSRRPRVFDAGPGDRYRELLRTSAVTSPTISDYALCACARPQWPACRPSSFPEHDDQGPRGTPSEASRAQPEPRGIADVSCSTTHCCTSPGRAMEARELTRSSGTHRPGSSSLSSPPPFPAAGPQARPRSTGIPDYLPQPLPDR